jgi:hypothetical protein
MSWFNDSVNSDVFYAWLMLDCLPEVKLEPVIVMDNIARRKTQCSVDELFQDDASL